MQLRIVRRTQLGQIKYIVNRAEQTTEGFWPRVRARSETSLKQVVRSPRPPYTLQHIHQSRKATYSSPHKALAPDSPSLHISILILSQMAPIGLANNLLCKHGLNLRRGKSE